MVLLVLGFKLFESRVVGSEVDLRLGFPFQTVLKCMVISRSSNKTCSDVFLFAVYFHCVSTPKASKQDDHDDHDDHVTHEFFFVRGYIVKQVICLVWKMPAMEITVTSVEELPDAILRRADQRLFGFKIALLS